MRYIDGIIVIALHSSHSDGFRGLRRQPEPFFSA
jgi:hypothetical protein